MLFSGGSVETNLPFLFLAMGSWAINGSQFLPSKFSPGRNAGSSFNLAQVHRETADNCRRVEGRNSPQFTDTADWHFA